MLIAGRLCYWKEIEIGEIFAVHGGGGEYWKVWEKVSRKSVRLLAIEKPYHEGEFLDCNGSGDIFIFGKHIGFGIKVFNKLSKVNQRLWKEE